MTAAATPVRAERRVPVLVLGLGNVLLSDDGVGAAALARLERDYHMVEDVHLVEGGTLGLSLLDEIGKAEHLILVDAVASDAPSGTLVRLDGTEVIDAVRDRLSAHQVGVADLLDAARLIGCYPRSVVLLGLVPATLGLAVARTEAVDAALSALVSAIVREVKALGYDLVAHARATQSSSTGAGGDGNDRPIHALVRHFGM